MHRARHTDLRLCGGARATRAVRAAIRRLDRRSVLVLPRVEVRHAPRLRTVGRPRRKALIEVAEPLLLHVGVRPSVLPEGDCRLCEHARRRQGDVRGLLPDGVVARSHLRRTPRRAVPRRGVAQVLAGKRRAGVQTVSRDAFEKARAEVGVIDTMIGFPAPREEQAKHYDFIRKQTHDADSQEWEFPAQYMFKGVPHYDRVDDPVEMLVAKMNELGIRKAITGLPTDGNSKVALERYPDRFFSACNPDPNTGMDAVRLVDNAVKQYDAK